MREKPEKKSRIKKGETLPEDIVRLPSIFGIKPGVYLAGIYSLILLAILFFVLIYPGLSKPGSVVVFTSEPSGAALRVDGVYAGTSPGKIFVPKGRHSLEVVLPGFTAQRVESEIPGRLFASALFPRKYPLAVELDAPDPAAVFAEAAGDYAAWTFAGEPTASWQIPLSLSEGAYRVGNTRIPAIESMIETAARFAVTRAALRDLVRAKFLSDNGGLSPSPAGLYRSAGEIAGFLSRTPGAAAWLKDTLPADSAAIISNSAWYKKQAAVSTRTEMPARADTPENPPADKLNLGGLSFTGIPGGLSDGRHIAAFMVCDTAVSKSAFDDFLTANPEWGQDRRETLIAEGLVTSSYLFDDKPEIMRNGSVTGVSWFAANAYCGWLSERLPPSLRDYEVRLPTEAEWEYGVTAPVLTGNMWEWCADPYVPLDFIHANPEAAEAISSPERSLRGRTTPSDIAGTRASLPPEFCSSFGSFRPVIALKTTR